MTTNRPFRWVEASKVRHAVPAELKPEQDDEVTTLCGQHAVVRNHDRQHECPFPECQ